jgi:hypothetical protein
MMEHKGNEMLVCWIKEIFNIVLLNFLRLLNLYNDFNLNSYVVGEGIHSNC